MPAPTADARTLTSDTSWLIGAKTIAYGASFLLPLALVRLLSQTDFGVYKQLYLLVGTAFGVLPLGFAMSAFYFLPRMRSAGGGVVLNVVLVHVSVAALAAGLLVVYPDLVRLIFDDPTLTRYARPVAAAVLVLVASSFLDLLALANGHVRLAALVIVTMNVSKTLWLVGAALVFGSVRAVVLAGVVHGAIQLMLVAVYLRSAFGRFWTRFDPGLLRAQIGYAVPLGLAGGLYWLQMEAHHFFVARAYGPATYAVYAIGCFSLPLTAVVGESLGSVVIQRVSRLHSERCHGEVVATLGRAMRGLAVFYLPLYALLLVVGSDLITVLFTEQYRASWPIFAVNLTLLPLAVLAIVSDAVVRSYVECRRFLVLVRIVLVSGLLAGLWLVTPRYGPLAAITLVVAVNVVERLLVAGRAARALALANHEASPLWSLAAIAVTACGAGLVAAAVRASLVNVTPLVSLVASSAAFVGVAALLAHRLPVLEDDERRMIRRVFADPFAVARLRLHPTSNPN